MSLSKHPRVKIVSDGFGKGTKLFDAEGNEILKGAVRSVMWTVGGPGPARVSIDLLPTAVEVEGDLEQITAFWAKPDEESVCHHEWQLKDASRLLHVCRKCGWEEKANR